MYIYLNICKYLHIHIMIVYINVRDELKYYRSQRNTAVIAFEIFTRYLPFPKKCMYTSRV